MFFISLRGGDDVGSVYVSESVVFCYLCMWRYTCTDVGNITETGTILVLWLNSYTCNHNNCMKLNARKRF